MTILKTLLVASLFLTGNTTEVEASGINANTTTSPVIEEVAETASFDELTANLSKMVKYPTFAANEVQSPEQEIIVKISFQVGEENSLDILKVHGNNEAVNKYVMENLDGRILEETPLLPGVTFHTTLRFVM